MQARHLPWATGPVGCGGRLGLMCSGGGGVEVIPGEETLVHYYRNEAVQHANRKVHHIDSCRRALWRLCSYIQSPRPPESDIWKHRTVGTSRQIRLCLVARACVSELFGGECGGYFEKNVLKWWVDTLQHMKEDPSLNYII